MSVNTADSPARESRFAIFGIPGSPLFTEVTGLDLAQPLDVLAASNPLSPRVEGHSGSIVLKKGTVDAHASLPDWFYATVQNSIRRYAIRIVLIGDDGRSGREWTLKDAFPVKLIMPDQWGKGDRQPVDRLQLNYRSLTVTPA